jgi:AcrR family transcriptional regulator
MYHDLIFESAERVFAEEGFDTATMQDLAHEAGVSLKTLYATFAGKDDIYREILEVRGAGLSEGISEIAGVEGPAIDRLAHGLGAVVAYLVEHRAFFRILIQEGKAWGLDPKSDGARGAWDTGIHAVRNVITAGVESGEFSECDVELLAPTVNAILQVQLAGLLDREKGDPDPEAITRTIMQSIARLLGVPPSDAVRAA